MEAGNLQHMHNPKLVLCFKLEMVFFNPVTITNVKKSQVKVHDAMARLKQDHPSKVLFHQITINLLFHQQKSKYTKHKNDSVMLGRNMA